MKKAMTQVEGDKELTERFMKAVLDDRNIGMANKADERRAAPAMIARPRFARAGWSASISSSSSSGDIVLR